MIFIGDPILMTPEHGNAFRITGPLWGEPPMAGGFPHIGQAMQSFNVIFIVILKLPVIWNATALMVRHMCYS